MMWTRFFTNPYDAMAGILGASETDTPCRHFGVPRFGFELGCRCRIQMLGLHLEAGVAFGGGSLIGMSGSKLDIEVES